MNPISFSFLSNILGLDGSLALRKAIERDETLETLLIPRAALSWVLSKSEVEYEGNIPGISNSYLKFQKNDKGFQGIVSLQDCNYEFEDASPTFLATTIGIVAGMSAPIKMDVKDGQLLKLGKSIDRLVKSQQDIKASVKTINKIEPQAQTAKPIPPGGFNEPEAPSLKQVKPKLPKPTKKMPALKIEKSEAAMKCEACGKFNFDNNKFKGCLCWSDLAKSINTSSYGDGYVLEFKGNVNLATFYALKKSLKGD